MGQSIEENEDDDPDFALNVELQDEQEKKAF